MDRLKTLLLTLLVTVSCIVTQPVGALAENLRIGVLFPLSGPLALLGNEGLAAAKIARDLTNEKGGVNGKKIEFVVADAPDATAANAEATRLIIREGVKLIAGSYSSAVCLAASEVAEREGVVYWETIAVADKITKRGYKNVIRLTFNAGMMGETAADYANELARRLKIPPKNLRVAVISEDSDFGQSVGDAAAKRVKELGLNLVENERYNRNLTDLSSLVLRLKAARTDVVIATSYLNDGITFWRQVRELDLNLKGMIGIGTGYALPDFQKAQGKYTDGIFDVDAPVKPKIEGLLPATRKLYEEFHKRFVKQVGRDPGPLALISFGGFHTLFTNVLPQAGSLDPSKVKAAALKLDLPKGSLLTGAGVKLNQDGQNTMALISVMQWQNQKLVVVWPDNIKTTNAIMVPLPDWSKR